MIIKPDFQIHDNQMNSQETRGEGTYFEKNEALPAPASNISMQRKRYNEKLIIQSYTDTRKDSRLLISRFGPKTQY